MLFKEVVTLYAVVMLRAPAFLAVRGRVGEYMGILP